MRAVARIVSLWRGVFRRARMDAELDAELASYYDELVARRQAAGLDADQAQSAARRELGNALQVRQAVRESWLVSSWDAAGQDLRQAWRGLRSTPGLTVLAVVTFALGIGSTTAILGVVRTSLLTPPPYRDPSRLVLVWADLTSVGYPRAPLSGPELEDLRTRTDSFEGVGAIWASSMVLSHEHEPEFIRIGLVTPDLFPLLGVEPAAGRLLEAADSVDGPPGSVLLSHRLWQRKFGGEASIVGRAVTVNGRPVIVTGVLPDGFRLLLPQDAGIPDALEAYQLLPARAVEGPRGQRYLRVLGRLKPQVTLAEARHDVERLAAELGREFPESDTAPLTTVSLTADNTRAVRQPIVLVAAGVALLLVIAAVNVLGVLVARAAARRREIAVRVALGAGLVRILRLALAEGLSLAAIGAVVGVAVGRAELAALVALQPEALRRLGEASLDAHVLAWTGGLALLWGALFAMAPLGEYARGNVGTALAGTRGELRRLRARTRSTLVVAQVALTLVLLVTAALLARTFASVIAVDPGFRAEGVLTFRVPSATPRYATPQARDALAHTLRDALLALPSVTGTGAVSHLPFDTIPNWGGPYSLVETQDGALPNADYRAISPGFLEAAGIELLSGRPFSEADGPEQQPVAIVDDRPASRLWPGRSPLGDRLNVDPGSIGSPDSWVSVVGVVRHVRHRSLVEPLNEQVYFPLSQAFRNPVAYLVRTSGDPGALTASVRAAVRSVDPTLPIYEMRPLAAYLDRAREVQRFTMVLVGVFAATALSLAAIGVYGVIAYVVVERRREFGVRLALGATRGQIGRLVIVEAARLVGIGAALGLAGAVFTSHLIRSQLFGVSPGDALTYCAPLPLLALAALLACLWPARRATAASVVDVLRAE
jgi:putative ABC transport system permease protein